MLLPSPCGCYLSIYLSIYPATLTDMVRTSGRMLNKSGQSGHPCLVLILERKSFPCSTTEYDVTCGLDIHRQDIVMVRIAGFDTRLPDRNPGSATSYRCNYEKLLLIYLYFLTCKMRITTMPVSLDFFFSLHYF